LMQAYHDQELGVPEHDSRALWEKLMLDGFQAGLAWISVLRKRDAFRDAKRPPHLRVRDRQSPVGWVARAHPHAIAARWSSRIGWPAAPARRPRSFARINGYAD